MTRNAPLYVILRNAPLFVILRNASDEGSSHRSSKILPKDLQYLLKIPGNRCQCLYVFTRNRLPEA